MFKFIIIAVVIAAASAGNIGLIGHAYSDASAVSSVYNSNHDNQHQQQHGLSGAYIAKQPVAIHSDAVAVSSVYNSLANNGYQHQQHGHNSGYIAKIPVAVHSSAPAAVSSVYSSISNNVHHQQQHHEQQQQQQHGLHSAYLVKSPIASHSDATAVSSVYNSIANSGYKHEQHHEQQHHQHQQQQQLQHGSYVAKAPLAIHSAIHSAPTVQIHSAAVHHSAPTITTVHHSAPATQYVKLQSAGPSVHASQHLNSGSYSYDKSYVSSAQPAIVYSSNKAPVAYAAAKEIRYSLAPQVSHVSVEGHGTHYAW